MIALNILKGSDQTLKAKRKMLKTGILFAVYLSIYQPSSKYLTSRQYIQPYHPGVSIVI